MRRGLVVLPIALVLAACSTTVTPSVNSGTSTGSASPTESMSASPSDSASPSGSAAPSEATAVGWTAAVPVADEASRMVVLNDVSCTARDACTATEVSSAGNGAVNSIASWTGEWLPEAGPDFGTDNSYIAGALSCRQAFCAVPYFPSSGAAKTTFGTMKLASDGWSSMEPDSIVGGKDGEKIWTQTNAVSCPDDSFCAAVGTSGPEGTSWPVVGTWDGQAWDATVLDALTDLDFEDLISVSCPSPTFCLAVGRARAADDEQGANGSGLAMRWDGKAWTALADTGTTSLESVSCTSESFCIAVGQTMGSGAIRVWDGSALTPEESPLADPLWAVSCASEDLCLVLPKPSDDLPLTAKPLQALRQQGTWSAVSGYPAPAAALKGVSCLDTWCLVVGSQRDTESTSSDPIEGAQATAAFYDAG